MLRVFYGFISVTDIFQLFQFFEVDTGKTTLYGDNMKHNIYFDGQVQSLRFPSQGIDVSVGVMAPGRYTFSTETDERVEILHGRVNFVSGAGEERLVIAGESYSVAAKSSFDVSCSDFVAYLCSFAR